MFKDSKAFSSFSVDDLEAAKAFYSKTLGLKVTEQEMGHIDLQLAGDNHVIIYPKGGAHKPATFTVLNFQVDNIEKAVDALTAKGITFEQYEGDIATDEKGISRSDQGPSVAWFKDPAGNILSVLEL